jgi:hypothetical protein
VRASVGAHRRSSPPTRPSAHGPTPVGDEALAAASLDRLLHDADVLAINGPSSRLKGRPDALKTPTREFEERARRIAQWRRRADVLVYFNNDWRASPSTMRARSGGASGTSRG